MVDWMLLLACGLLLGLLWHMWRRRQALELDLLHSESLRRNQQRVNEEQQQMQQAVYDTLHDGLIIATTTQKRIVNANAKAQQLLGRTLINETVMAVTRSYELDALLKELDLQPEEFQERVLEIDHHILRARVSRVSSLSEPIYIILLRDETELNRLSRARRDMVANISHELRTPITNISLNADTLLNGALKKPKRSVKLVKGIRREVDTLTQLVEEMRDLSRIESGQMPVKLMPTPLLPLIQQSTEQLEALAESKTQRITVAVPQAIVVLADAHQVRRVIKNIVHNAIKFSPLEGTIAISATSEGDEATITVTNNGPPVPPDELPRLFERFYQVDKARGDGTGLGLAIARHIVLSHDGRIWAENLPNQAGVAFYFTLPLSDTVLETADALHL